MGCLCTHG